MLLSNAVEPNSASNTHTPDASSLSKTDHKPNLIPPVPMNAATAELATRIDRISKELNEIKRVCAGIARREFGELNGYPTVKDIQHAVASYYGITILDIQSHRRLKSIVLPRQVAIYLARTMTLLGSPQIARKFADRDHTTVLHAVRKIEGLLQTDKKLEAEIKHLTAAIRGQA